MDFPYKFHNDDMDLTPKTSWYPLGPTRKFLELDEMRFYLGDRDYTAWIYPINDAGETPMHIAARRNNLQLFEPVLQFYTSSRMGATDNAGNTVFHVLADHAVEENAGHRRKRVKLIQTLISKGADINKKNKYGWTLVHFAAKHCHVDLLKILEKDGAQMDLPTTANETPLILTCKNMFKIKNGSIKIKTIDFFLDRFSNINATDEEGYSALHYALESCSCKIVIKLLKHGADVHLRTREHKLTPLHFAAIKEDKSLPIVKILLKAGAIVESPGIGELSPLHMSLLGDSSDVVQHVIENGADVNYLERNLQFSPLHVAIYQQRYDLFQLLIDKGADVNVSGKLGLTPLHLASILGCSQFTKSLLFLGARVKCLYDNSLTPLHLATLKSHLGVDSELMGAAAIRHGHENTLIAKLLTYPHSPTGQDYEAVIKLLLRNDADVNALTSDGWSSLLFAAKLGRHTASFVKILLRYYANDFREPSSEFTALHFAVENNFYSIVEVLVDSGADVNAVTKDGRTPVHLALNAECTKVLKLLIKNEANIECKEANSQLTPLHLAMEKKYYDAAALLIDAEADINPSTDDGKSLMHLALESRSKCVLNSLMKRRAKLDCTEKRCLYTFLCMNADNKDNEMIDKLYDYGKTSFSYVTDSLENRKIKKLVNSLCVVVDATIDNSCMPVNYKVENDYIENSKLLCNEYGVNINDLEAYWRFSSDRVLCGAYNEFMDCTILIVKSTEYLTDYLSMLNAVNLPLSDECRQIKPRIPDDLQGYEARLRNEKCIDEVKKLRAHSVADGVTLYDVLHMRPSRSRFYTKILNLCEIEKQFEIYYKLMLARYREDIIKKTLMEAAQSALYQLTNILVPILCIEKIFFDLNIMNTIATISAAEMID